MEGGDLIGTARTYLVIFLGPITIDIVPEIVMQWIIMLFIIAIALCTTRDLKIKPDKKQATVELFYEKLKIY